VVEHVYSALEVCYENAQYKFTFDIWHLTVYTGIK